MYMPVICLVKDVEVTTQLNRQNKKTQEKTSTQHKKKNVCVLSTVPLQLSFWHPLPLPPRVLVLPGSGWCNLLVY